MTAGRSSAGLDDRVAADVLARAADPDACARWHDQVRRVGWCARPVRLAGRVHSLDADSGQWRLAYSTATEPDGCLLKACGQRRASVCPSCSATYQSDAFQLLAAGLRGGKGVPESVQGHPALFVTFTAPGFGPVHARRERHGRIERCRPRRDEVCPHGVRLDCRLRHRDDDEALGRPLCAECFDYAGAVVWNATAPELWRRTTVYLRRALAREAGMTNQALAKVVRVSFTKVAEYQRRGLVHFHAVVRLDGAGAGYETVPPPERFDVAMLERAVRSAAAAVAAPRPGGPLRWGSQLDVRGINAGTGSLSRGAVAGYVAKYATKSTDPLGRLDRRLAGLEDLDARGVPAHLHTLAETAWRLGEHEPRLRRWAHALGFGGHWMTKSRRYSTTFAALRSARAAWAASNGGQADVDHEAEPPERFGEWRLVGIGYRTEGDRLLAISAGAWAREQRRIAREELGAAA